MSLAGFQAGDYRVLTPEEVEAIQGMRRRYPDPRSAMMPALWLLQNREGILTSQGMREVAWALEMAPAQVEAVASFYSMYSFKPHGRFVIEMCTNVSCLLAGARPVMKALEKKLGIGHGQTTADGAFTLLEVECLGACGAAPAAQVNQRFFENLSPEGAASLVDELRAGATDLQALPTGVPAARAESPVNLHDPGANRLPLPRDGAAGPIVDLVRESTGTAPPERRSRP
jgi:NADH-quinone oxidoreductase subunit E